MIAPTLPYGITGSMEAYPGAFQITEAAYRPFVKQILEGLAKNGFRNIIILNGHGGGQTAVLQSVAAEVATEKKVRTLVDQLVVVRLGRDKRGLRRGWRPRRQ